MTDLPEILQRHGIHSQFHEEFRALVEDGVRPSADLRTRLRRVANYRACLKEILERLSEPFAHLYRYRKSKHVATT